MSAKTFTGSDDFAIWWQALPSTVEVKQTGWEEGDMTGRNGDETLFRGEVLINLRHGRRQTSQLAQQLAADAIVGPEARGLLGRLQAIRAELDALSFAGLDVRRAQNDPIWSEPPHPFHQNGAS
jgi:hypothetical protein